MYIEYKLYFITILSKIKGVNEVSLAVNRMSLVVKRSSIMMMIFALLISLMAFLTPSLTADASSTKGNDPGAVDVKVTNGKLSVSGGGFTDGGSAKAWEEFIAKYRNFITGVAGIGAVTMIVLFIIQFMKLGASAGNPQARSQALVGVLWTGIAAAGLGAVTIIVGFFYNSVG